MRWLFRPVCWLVGHSWEITRAIPRCNDLLYHLCMLAACDANCQLCGAKWRDVDDHMATHRDVLKSPCEAPVSYRVPRPLRMGGVA